MYRDGLHPKICNVKEGIQTRDVGEAVRLWKDFDLGSLPMNENDIWGGPPAVFFPDPDREYQGGDEEGATSPAIGIPVESSISAYTPSTKSSVDDVEGNGQDQKHRPMAPRRFHPEFPDRLHVGREGHSDDQSDVWLSITARTGQEAGTLSSTYYNSSLHVVSMSDLDRNGFSWNDEFKLDRFPSKGTGNDLVRKKERARRKFMYSIIQSHIRTTYSAREDSADWHPFGGTKPKRKRDRQSSANIPTNKAFWESASNQMRQSSHHAEAAREGASQVSPPPSKRFRRMLIDLGLGATPPSWTDSEEQTNKNNVDGTNVLHEIDTRRIDTASVTNTTNAVNAIQPQNDRQINLSTTAIARTSLHVRFSNKADRAPINVSLEDCQTHQQFFNTLISEGDLKGEAARQLSEVSATFTWDQEEHRIRKGRPRDWEIFCEAIEQVWDTEASRFSKERCKIKMMAHIDS